jgi:hypothetical protein
MTVPQKQQKTPAIPPVQAIRLAQARQKFNFLARGEASK